MNNAERAAELFDSGLNCCQAVLTVFGEPYGLCPATAKRVARAFGGGMGRLGKTCGAVSGAVAVLGLASDREDESEAKKVSYSYVQEFFRRFEALHGATDCRGLLGTDVSTEEGYKQARESELFKNVCPAFVKDAATILEELLEP
jgi:C_GCAxxG_C_C family probable redox protein